MDIFLRDGDFKKIAYLDEFDSFIWKERYNSYGDFEMVLPKGSRSNWVSIGSYITHSESHRVMVIEERHDRIDSEGKESVLIKGRSLESILERRVVIPNRVPGLSWYMKDRMSEIVTTLVGDICYRGVGLSDLDIIPSMYVVNDTFSDSTIVSAAVKVKPLYDAVKELCDSANLGFAINLLQLNNDASRHLRFFVYEGRTQPNTIFGTVLDNLTNVSGITKNTDHRNVAYVWSKDGKYRTIVAPKGASAGWAGLDRRVMMVEAGDVDTPDIAQDEILEVLRQRGREELSKQKRDEAFDGEITPDSKYVYNAHYGLGDTVTFVDQNGRKYPMVVAEQIWSVDSNGTKSYPTFKTEQL